MSCQFSQFELSLRVALYFLSPRSRYLRDALTVPFVGKRLAQKIDEIVASGRLRRLEAVDKEKQQQAAAVCIVLVRSCSLGKS